MGGFSSEPPAFADVRNWLHAFVQPTVLIELGALIVCVLLAWGIVTALARGLQQGDSRSILFGNRVVDGALFPIMLLGLGVGIGFGLQKLAANYVSGFVILAERSMRIGDNVKLDTFEGRITQINARHTVIRSPSGRESIVPNELLITQRVENLSLSDTRVWMSTMVSVAYESDVDLVARLLTEAALASPRVLRDPAPGAALSAFGADGLEYTLGFWIADPENGSLGLRSDINMAVLQALRAHHIQIPYPQRVMHVQSHEPHTMQSQTAAVSGSGLPSSN